MLKKAYFLLTFTSFFTSINMFGMQLTNVQGAIKASLRAYQKQVAILKEIEKNKPQLASMVPVLEKIVAAASQEFKDKMKAAVEEQYNTIVDQNAPFSAVKYEAGLTDLVPSAPNMNVQVQKMFAIIVQREYFQLLWQKLSNKERELTTEFESLEKEIVSQES